MAKIKQIRKKVTFNRNKSKLASGNYQKCKNCGGDGIVRKRKK